MDKQFHIFQNLFLESGPGFDYPPEDSTGKRDDWRCFKDDPIDKQSHIFKTSFQKAGLASTIRQKIQQEQETIGNAMKKVALDIESECSITCISKFTYFCCIKSISKIYIFLYFEYRDCIMFSV